MKKRLVSLVAAAALLGSVSIAAAGTVTTKGDTNITIGGFIQTYFDWANNQDDLGYIAYPKYVGYDKKGNKISNEPAQTTFGTTTSWTRLSLGLNNPTEGIKGTLEGDFFGGGANQQLYNKGNFRMRHAYIVKEFCQEGCNYTPWLLMGQTWDPLDVLDSFSLNSIVGIAGQNANSDNVRTSQIAFGVKFDLGGVKLNPAIYVANMAKDQYFNGNVSSLNPYINATQRLTSPGFVFKLPAEFNTGLGAPATAFVAFGWQPMKLTFNDGKPISISNGFVNYSVTHQDEEENAWMAEVGLTLPVYFVNLTGNVRYGRGMTGYENGVVTSKYTFSSFYVDPKDGSIEKIYSTGWTAQAQVDFNKLIQMPFTLAFGYGQVVFSNYRELGDQNQNVWPFARKESTIFANVNYNLTKSLSFGLEYQRNKTWYVGAANDNDSNTANQVFLRGNYNF